MLNNMNSAQTSDDTIASAQLQHIQQWIKRLEDRAIELLDGLAIDEMTPKHQADVALKCLDHIQRFSAIEKRLQDASQANDQRDLLANFMRAARGEYDLPDNECNALIKDETNHAHSDKEGRGADTRDSCLSLCNHHNAANTPAESPCECIPTPNNELPDKYPTKQAEDEMIENFTRRIAEKARQREKDEKEELWQWLTGMMDQAREEGKDFWQWLDEQEEERQWNYQPEDDISQDEDDDFWQRIDELVHEHQEPPWSHEEMSQEDERDLRALLNQQDREQSDHYCSEGAKSPQKDQEFWQWLAEQEKEWQEYNWSDKEAAQEEDSWLNNGWWLDEDDLPGDEELPWEEY
jgi:hypothetical protein